LVGHLIVLGIAALFIRLGFWQLDRLAEVRAANATIESRQAAAPVPLDSLVTAEGGGPERSIYRRATVTGTYDAGHEVAVRFRSLRDQPGSWVLTPLVTPTGTAVLVNRGWVPGSDPNAPLPASSRPPDGTVTVTGTVLSPEAEGGTSPEPSGGVLGVTRIDVGAIGRDLPYPLFPVYLRLQLQRPDQASGAPVPVPAPALGEGPHLSYAIQWFLFTAVGLIGWPLLIRRGARERMPPGPRVSGVQSASVD
jgi:cytochrome oxidase assembly protein ShyY1